MPKSTPKAKAKPAKIAKSKPALKAKAKVLKPQAKAAKSAAPKKAQEKPLKAAKPVVAKASKENHKENHKDNKEKELKKKAPPVATPSAKDLKKTAKDEAKAEAKAAKKAGKKAKKTDEFEMEDDLIGDEELGSEEIPDLAEFEEAEEELEEESDDSLEMLGEGPKGTDDEIILTDAEGRRYCRVRDCDQISGVEGYCRYHYLLLWKRIQVRRRILADGKLEHYVEELTARYPDKFLEMIRKDLRTEKDFHGAIAELEIDESNSDGDFEDEAQSFIDEVRGITETSANMSDDEEF